ncbi:MAG: uroporphyrinogen decarboxylase [Actinomycetota bacterium]|nr:uroporphyrinogen decarboxylase [Actinomycetota bacterium]
MVPSNDLFLRACRREPTDHTPVWFMRQAGRYQRDYQALRKRFGILEICRTPELAAEVTLSPVRQLGVDAAILFSDIVVPVAAMGIDVRIEEGRGPVVDAPLRTSSDVKRLRPLEPERDVPFVLEAVRMVVRELDVPLIGFAGAPFTLASYLIEGGSSRNFTRTKALMLEGSATWRDLMERLGAAVLAYARAQVEAGASAVQIFDSWVGALGPDDYEEHVLPFVRPIFEGLAGLGVPLIHFGVGTSELLELMRDAGADVVGVDWRIPLDRARERLGPGVAIQGNLDPAVLLAPWEVVERRARDVLARAGGRPGHVFNLGHGVLPETAPETLRRLTELVHDVSARQEVPAP